MNCEDLKGAGKNLEQISVIQFCVCTVCVCQCQKTIGYLGLCRYVRVVPAEYLSEVGGSLLRCGMLGGKICEDQR